MNIALLNTKIKIQKATASTDSYGNHSNAWTDWFTCSATISNEGGTESIGEETLLDSATLSFTVRWSSETKVVTTLGYRIKYGDVIFDILSIDHMNNKHKSVKFNCKKVPR